MRINFFKFLQENKKSMLKKILALRVLKSEHIIIFKHFI